MNRGTTFARLDQFEGGSYSSINLTSALFEERVDGEENIKLEVWDAPGMTKATFEEVSPVLLFAAPLRCLVCSVMGVDLRDHTSMGVGEVLSGLSVSLVNSLWVLILDD